MGKDIRSEYAKRLARDLLLMGTQGRSMHSTTTKSHPKDLGTEPEGQTSPSRRGPDSKTPVKSPLPGDGHSSPEPESPRERRSNLAGDQDVTGNEA
jgi:hypothetical protein